MSDTDSPAKQEYWTALMLDFCGQSDWVKRSGYVSLVVSSNVSGNLAHESHRENTLLLGPTLRRKPRSRK